DRYAKARGVETQVVHAGQVGVGGAQAHRRLSDTAVDDGVTRFHAVEMDVGTGHEAVHGAEVDAEGQALGDRQVGERQVGDVTAGGVSPSLLVVDLGIAEVQTEVEAGDALG